MAKKIKNNLRQTLKAIQKGKLTIGATRQQKAARKIDKTLFGKKSSREK